MSGRRLQGIVRQSTLSIVYLFGEKALLTFWKKLLLRLRSTGVAGVVGAVAYLSLAPVVGVTAVVPSAFFLGVTGEALDGA